MLETLQKVSPPDNGKMGDTRSQSAGNAISWLAGFVDGEGSIGFDKVSSKRDFHYPTITITNCHLLTMERIINILSDYGIRFWVTTPNHRNSKWKPYKVVVIRGLRRVKPFLELLLPYLYTKREQAQLVLDFANYRLSLPAKTPYGDKEKDMIAKIRNLNHRGPSETTRAPQKS